MWLCYGVAMTEQPKLAELARQRVQDGDRENRIAIYRKINALLADRFGDGFAPFGVVADLNEPGRWCSPHITHADLPYHTHHHYLATDSDTFLIVQFSRVGSEPGSVWLATRTDRYIWKPCALVEDLVDLGRALSTPPFVQRPSKI